MVHGKYFQYRKYRKTTFRERILPIYDAKYWQKPQYCVTVLSGEGVDVSSNL